MQPGAPIQQTQLVLDVSDGCILLICQGPVACVDDVALYNTNHNVRFYPLMMLLEHKQVCNSMLMLQSKYCLAQLQNPGADRWQVTAHLDVLGGTRLDQHAGAVLHSPSDNHLLGNAITLLANLPDDGVLQMKHLLTL